MVNLLKSELFRVRKRPQAWIMILLLVVFEVALYAGLVIASFVRDDPASVNRNIQLGRLWEIGLIPTQIASGIMLIVFASSLMGNEYGWNTIRPLIARSRTRTSLLTAKWLTVLLYALALCLAGVLAAVIGSVAGSLLVGVDTGLTGDRVVDIVATIGRYAAAALPYGALAFVLAVLTKSNVAGIAIAIALSFLEDVIFLLLGALADFFETIQKGGLAFNVNRLVFFGSQDDITRSEAFVSLGVVSIYVALFVLIAYRIFLRRDVTTG